MRLLAQILASTLFVSPVLAQDQSLAVTDALSVTDAGTVRRNGGHLKPVRDTRQ